jgi:hypothetical protein
MCNISTMFTRNAMYRERKLKQLLWMLLLHYYLKA